MGALIPESIDLLQHYVKILDTLQITSTTKAPYVFKYNTYKIYVNDGSNGPNVVYAYNYRNYNDGSMPPFVANNYKRNEVRSYNSQDGTILHATGDINSYSDYTISQKVKWKVSQSYIRSTRGTASHASCP